MKKRQPKKAVADNGATNGDALVRLVKRKPMQHLKKCPVCNMHDGVIVMETKIDEGTEWERVFTQVRCKRCNVSTSFFEGSDSEICANEAWNRRDNIMCDSTLRR